MNAKILVACANGAGTSLMMKMTAERVTKKLGMGVADIHHCALSEGVSSPRASPPRASTTSSSRP